MPAHKSNTLIDPKEVILENLKFLREYAHRLLVEDDASLTPIEDFKEVSMNEYLKVGTTLGLTERDLIVLLLKKVLDR